MKKAVVLVAVAVLVALTLLQPVRPQSTENHSTNKGEPHPPVLDLDHYLLQLSNKLDTLNTKLEVLQASQQQTAWELSNLQTSISSKLDYTSSKLDSTSSKLDSAHSKLDSTSSKLDSAHSKLDSTSSKLDSAHSKLDSTSSKLDSTSSKLDSAHSKLDSTSSKLDYTSSKLDSTSSKLDSAHSKLDSTSSKLDFLTATTAQLSSEHQQIIDSMTDVECLDTQQTVQLHQNMQDITQQLKKIKDDVTFIRGPYTCGGTGGWRRVAYLDMTDPHTTCPSGWKLTGYSKRTCGRVSTGRNTCDSATFPVSGGQYSTICGRITAYQYGGPDAFRNTGRSIDEAYACGVSVTHGTPRNHIWTFVAGVSEGERRSVDSCPCDSTATITIPQFVGNDYFCESGINEPWSFSRHYTLHSNDLLWDGEDCLLSSTCCSLHNPPYFVKQLPTSTTDDIEARICVNDLIRYTNIAVELVELYVQ